VTTIALICGWLAAALLAYMALLFWRSPDNGLKQTTHKLENLPLVMANRYTAFAILGAAIVISGNLALLAVFFAVSALMGLADGWNYARSGLPHIKHTASGVLALVALGITLIARGT
jgi:hypothetical protein